MSFYGRSTYEVGKLFRNFEIFNEFRNDQPSEGFPFNEENKKDIIYPNELYDTLIMVGADPWLQLNSDKDTIAFRHFKPQGNKTNYTPNFSDTIKLDRAGHIHLTEKTNFDTYLGTKENLYTIKIPALPEIKYQNTEDISTEGILGRPDTNSIIRFIPGNEWIQLDATKSNDVFTINYYHKRPYKKGTVNNVVNFASDFNTIIKVDGAGHIGNPNVSEDWGGTITIPALPNLYAYSIEDNLTKINGDGKTLRGTKKHYIPYDDSIAERYNYKEIVNGIELHNLNICTTKADFRIVAADKWIELSRDRWDEDGPGAYIEFRHHIPGQVNDNQTAYIIEKSQETYKFTDKIYFDEARHLVGKVSNSVNNSYIQLPAFPTFIVTNIERSWAKTEGEKELTTQNVSFAFVGADKWIALNGAFNNARNEIAFRHTLTPIISNTEQELDFGDSFSMYFDQAGHITNAGENVATAFSIQLPKLVMTCFDS